MVDYQFLQNTIQKHIDTYILAPTGLEHSQAKKLAIQLGVSSAVVYYFFRLIVYRLYLNPVNKIPGPKVSWTPLMGNFGEVMREEAGLPHKRWTKKYGGIFVYHGQWNLPRVVVTDHKLLKQVLTTQEYDFIKTPEASDFLRRVLGNGLLVAEGATHRHQRKMLTPAFSLNSIRAMLPLMAIPGYRLRDSWLKLIAETPEDKRVGDEKDMVEIIVSTGLSMATLDVIGWSLGQDFKSVDFVGTDAQSKLSQAYLHIFSTDASIMRILTFIFPILRHLPTKRNLLMKKNLKWLDKESGDLVQDGIDRAGKEKESGASQQKIKDLLATMVSSIDGDTGQTFTAEELRNQCLTFLAAGHETTSVSMSWCLWLLAKNQSIQDQLREEVREMFKDDNEIPNYEEINSLPLLDNVVRETLRLIPPVPVTSRVTRVPVTLGGYYIPKGTSVFIPPIVNHHSTEIWGDDAEEFNPSRWENTEKLGNTYQYMPFLAGGRMCIGYKFALIEFKILLALLIKNLQYFEKPGFNVVKKQQLTLRPSPNMTLWVKAV